MATILNAAPGISAELRGKDARLREIIAADGAALVAYSGGVDSAFLAWTTRRVLGREAMLAVIADSASLPRTQLRRALAFAAEHDIPVAVVAGGEVERAEYRRNDAGRCYVCKSDLFERLEAERTRRGSFRVLSYGLNRDDRGDFRPGQRAAAEHAVRAPLAAAALGKEEIRALARAAGLEVWDRPAAPCLASRVAYGLEVTPARLARVEAAEEAVAALGFREFRVRCHGGGGSGVAVGGGEAGGPEAPGKDDVARLEIAREEMPRALDPAMAARLAAALKSAGFRFVALDLEGFRSGGLNVVLPAAAK